MDARLNRLDPNIPDPVESRRRVAGRLVRFVYGTCVFGLIGFLVLYFGAPLVFLGGPGVVSAPRHVVSLPYIVQVISLKVAPGDTINAGDDIAQIRSPQQDEIVAAYMRALAELAGREAELRIRERVARDSLQAVRSQLAIAEEAVQRIEAAKQEITSLSYRIDVYRERATAQKAVASQEAEIAEAAIQLSSLAELRQRLHNQLDRTERGFADGRVVSPIAGIVSMHLARVGQSLVAGSPIAEIFDAGDIFIDWYIPNRRLVDPAVGNAVFIVYGNRRIAGQIAEILPISSVFGAGQPFLSERQSSQIARIRFDPDATAPALSATVGVRMYYANILARGAAGLVDLLGLR